MIDNIQLPRNVEQFDSVTGGNQLPFSKITLLYAENGRGKSTLAAILRLLGTGDGKLITERRRLRSPLSLQAICRRRQSTNRRSTRGYDK
jgi:wobble nucleotide-excising tRNase